MSPDTAGDAIRWRIDPSVRFRKVLDEAVLIQQDKAEVLVLNLTGYAFLEGCRQGLDLHSIVNQMLADFEVERDALIADLREWIQEMESRGIVHPVQDEAST